MPVQLYQLGSGPAMNGGGWGTKTMKATQIIYTCINYIHKIQYYSFRYNEASFIGIHKLMLETALLLL